MPIPVTRDDVRRLIAEDDAQLVEVLPQGEFDEEHLEGALHLSLKQLRPDTAGVLDPGRPVIVYCWDAL